MKKQIKAKKINSDKYGVINGSTIDVNSLNDSLNEGVNLSEFKDKSFSIKKTSDDDSDEINQTLEIEIDKSNKKKLNVSKVIKILTYMFIMIVVIVLIIIAVIKIAI